MKERNHDQKKWSVPDLHIHTSYCGHAKGSIEDMIESAIQRGFQEIGLSGHFPYPREFEEPVPNCVIPNDLFKDYVSEVERMRDQYQDRIITRFSVEVDYLGDYIDAQRSMLNQLSLDYIFGSIHIIDRVPIDYQEEVLVEHLPDLGGVQGMWEKYWERMASLIESGICDVIAHLDLPKKFNAATPENIDFARIEYILDLIKTNGLVLEINTGGIDRTASQEPYPSFEILNLAAQKGIEITLGSDAHHPEEIGRHFEQILEPIKDLGWQRVVTFERRQKQFLPI